VSHDSLVHFRSTFFADWNMVFLFHRLWGLHHGSEKESSEEKARKESGKEEIASGTYAGRS
jgi:hypothetical protein